MFILRFTFKMCQTLFFVPGTVSVVLCKMVNMAEFIDVHCPTGRNLHYRCNFFKTSFGLFQVFVQLKKKYLALVKQRQNSEDQFKKKCFKLHKTFQRFILVLYHKLNFVWVFKAHVYQTSHACAHPHYPCSVRLSGHQFGLWRLSHYVHCQQRQEN